MFKAGAFDIDLNLKPLSEYLGQRGVQHRIIEESGKQVIWVEYQGQVSTVNELIKLWQSGAVDFVSHSSSNARPSAASGVRGLVAKGTRQLLILTIGAPVTMLLIFACLLVALVSNLGMAASRVDFLFYPELPSTSLGALLGGIGSFTDIFQALAPMFLHFGELHLIFNLLWLWYFGRQLERVQSSWTVLIVIALISIIANTSQYLYSHLANFGGMSGVVYGLVGYVWVLRTFLPGSRLMINHSMFLVFIVAMVLMEIFASSWIATAAHAGGLAMGVLLGAIFVVFYLYRPRLNR